MALSTRDKIIVLAVLVAVAIFLIVNSMSSSTSAVENEGSLSYSGQIGNNSGPEDDNVSMKSGESQSLSRKFRTRDSAPEGTYKHSSYAEGNRSKSLNDLDRFFESVSPLEEPAVGQLNGFDESGGMYANYKGGNTRKYSDEDKFNASELLPKEHKYDWYDDSQATPVANTHLINISRPAGVNTTLSTKKIACRDIRGIIPNPRNYVGPWNMSSVEPDMNIKTGALC